MVKKNKKHHIPQLNPLSTIQEEKQDPKDLNKIIVSMPNHQDEEDCSLREFVESQKKRKIEAMRKMNNNNVHHFNQKLDKKIVWDLQLFDVLINPPQKQVPSIFWRFSSEALNLGTTIYSKKVQSLQSQSISVFSTLNNQQKTIIQKKTDQQVVNLIHTDRLQKVIKSHILQQKKVFQLKQNFDKRKFKQGRLLEQLQINKDLQYALSSNNQSLNPLTVNIPTIKFQTQLQLFSSISNFKQKFFFQTEQFSQQKDQIQNIMKLEDIKIQRKEFNQNNQPQINEYFNTQYSTPLNQQNSLQLFQNFQSNIHQTIIQHLNQREESIGLGSKQNYDLWSQHFNKLDKVSKTIVKKKGTTRSKTPRIKNLLQVDFFQDIKDFSMKDLTKKSKTNKQIYYRNNYYHDQLASFLYKDQDIFNCLKDPFNYFYFQNKKNKEAQVKQEPDLMTIQSYPNQIIGKAFQEYNNQPIPDNKNYNQQAGVIKDFKIYSNKAISIRKYKSTLFERLQGNSKNISELYRKQDDINIQVMFLSLLHLANQNGFEMVSNCQRDCFIKY